MDHPSTRPTQDRTRRTSPVPPQAAGPGGAGPAAVPSGPRDGAGQARPAAGPTGSGGPPVSPVAGAVRTVLGAVRRAVVAVRQMPNPRLTGLGSGLFGCAVMLLVAGVCRLLFDESAVVYGVLFLPVSALSAFWVRPADLVTAPVGVPIAFAVGIWPIAGGSEGLGGQLMGLVTALAVNAGWLYGGTLIAGVIVSVRKIRIMSRKREMRAAAMRSRGAARDGRVRAPRDAARQASGPAGRAGRRQIIRAPGQGAAPQRIDGAAYEDEGESARRGRAPRDPEATARPEYPARPPRRRMPD
ncbi:hypothetical protein DSC45_17165 [Streptomyces sp. YIM 130001]|nr:hypothetical protein DSC45_17165 [Streptomyces sp. YIM 130001]